MTRYSSVRPTDAAAELGMAVTETLCVDDLRAGATGRVGCGVAAVARVDDGFCQLFAGDTFAECFV